MSPLGTLLVARARHSFGGIDCRKCSIAGNSSTGSNSCFSRSVGMLRASFQIHFNTNSATFASFESGMVPFSGNGLTICSSKENNALSKRKLCITSDTLHPHLKTVILRHVAKSRRMIILINRERSFTLLLSLSSVWSSRRVSSSNNPVKFSTCIDSANNG